VLRNAILSALARALRREARPGGARERLAEGILFAIGWAVWPLDALLRIAAFVRYASAGAPPGRIVCRGTLLLRAEPAGPGASGTAGAEARATMLLRGADALFREHGIALSLEEPVRAAPLPAGIEPPTCGLHALVGRFFAWASSRAAAPGITVFFVESLGRYAGCAVPGADWVLVDLRTDPTTIVHEIGHLADLWAHHRDPANIMTNRPGGGHDRLTPFQARVIRTSRFVTRAGEEGGGRLPRSSGSPRVRGKPTRSGS
jgi:hypothetical protein